MRKELLKKRDKLRKEIDELKDIRAGKEPNIDINALIREKKKEHEFYNMLLKSTGKEESK